ncbi:MAG TPA: cytochrome c peroxidase, partial [Gemmatimonadaceae bacterium]|nr:cytochrome c peroxidase [Gemmatimonadaceae bacterium]
MFAVAITCTLLGACTYSDAGRLTAPVSPATNAIAAKRQAGLDATLRRYLGELGYTGRIASTLEARLGRRIDRRLANVGRMLWFDPITALRGDNSCAGCHSPTHGFGDTQSIAIGIENNGIVGIDRAGPRNQRRSPMMPNTAFYPTLMWNSRFRSLSGDPFDNSAGFQFPRPEERSLSRLPHLLAAQAFIPPTERVEAAGFEFPGDNQAIRAEVLRRLEVSAYRQLFGHVFPEIRRGAAITFEHLGRALAEFEFTQVYANAPIDRYARGNASALSDAEKSGAVLFFGRAGCVRCHQVSGTSNEMFSDFREHVIGVPQVAPSFGNVVFDGPDADEDFGLEQVTGRAADRYGFRTSPLRNVALQPTFMHNGAFVRLEDAIRHHLNAYASARAYSSRALAPDLRGPTGPIDPVLERLDPLLRAPL